jgi:nucleoid-associated protein YgaU
VTKTEPATAAPAVEDEQQTAAAVQSEQVAPAVDKPKDGRVVIQPGNNLWRISRVLYGSGNKYVTLYQANKDQIRDPDMIYPGQIFKTPDVVPKQESIDPHRRDPLKPEENAATAP